MGKLIDLVGQRFSRLQVLKQAQSISGNARWLCKCDCGNEVVVYGSRLRSGATKSCGCYMRESASQRRASDLAGKKFNYLTVLGFDHQDDRNNYVWKCECDCGNTVYATSYALKSGHTKSCGCLQKQIAGTRNLVDLTGQRFTKLVVKERHGSNANGQALWLCQCDCGNITVASSVMLTHGYTHSCGCIKSVGEQMIMSWLQLHHIVFHHEHYFDDCRVIAPLRFDFYLPLYG